MLHLLRNHLFLGIFIALLTFVTRLVIDKGFEVELSAQFWLRDFVGNWAFALLVYLLVRSLNKTLIAAGVFIFLFQMGNALKLVILGTPASPDDFFNIQNVFFLTEGLLRIAMYAIAALPFVLVLLFIPWRKPSVWLSIAALAGAGFAMAHSSEQARSYLDSRFGNSVWNQPANYKSRGLVLHLTQETIRTISKTGKTPDKEAVEAALSEIDQYAVPAIRLEPSLQTLVSDFTKSTAGEASKRNVHVFVLESFFDPTALGLDWVPEDPFPESFRALWAETGNSKALSPVFGGYTANAEFEVLCGFPVTRNAVFFEGWLRKAAPCLPTVLKQRGYSTLAAHPNVPGFWNRTHAYKLVGFDHYLSKENFDMSESVRGLLLDDSFYNQIYARLDANEFQQPVFNYMLTYHGHLPYPSNENYPDKIEAGKESKLLHGYLNQMWYKSRDLMRRVEKLRQSDPDSLIVIFGDHLPYLGQNYGVYTESWQLPPQRDQFNGEQLERLTSTPLIVIDGKRGPLKLGKLPLYRLPSLMLALLGVDNQASMFNLPVNPESTWIRPVYGMHISVGENASHACAEHNKSADECRQSAQWLQRTELLIKDIFTGDQISLDALEH